MAAVARMPTDEYVRWNQQRTASLTRTWSMTRSLSEYVGAISYAPPDPYAKDLARRRAEQTRRNNDDD